MSPTRAFWLASGALLVLRLISAWLVPISADEAYYWLWARQPAFSYFDHPPMAAWWIAAGRALFGDTWLGIRVFATLSIALIGWALFAFTRMQAGTHAAARLGIALQLLPFANLGGVIMTPDTPLALFWTLSILAILHIQTYGTRSGWLLFGLAAGLGLLSKYSMFLVFPIAGAALIVNRRGKRTEWAGLLAATLLALLVFSPVIAWNLSHDLVSFRFQFAHISGGPGAWWLNLLATIAAQLALFSPLFLLLFIRGSLERNQSKTARTLALFAWTPLACVLMLSLLTHTEAGWAAMAAISGLWWVWLENGRGQNARPVWTASLIVAGLFTLALYGYAAWLAFSQRSLGLEADVRDFERSNSAALERLPLVAERYQSAALVAFHFGKSDVTTWPGAYPRQSQFDIRPRPALGGGFVYVSARAGAPPGLDDTACACRPWRASAPAHVHVSICLPIDEKRAGCAPAP